MKNSDWSKLQEEDLVGRKVWVQGVIAVNVNGSGNAEVDFSTNISGTVTPHTRAFIHVSTIKKLLEPDLKVGGRVTWVVPSPTLTESQGTVLWSDEDYVLIRWDGEPEPVTEVRENVKAVPGDT